MGVEEHRRSNIAHQFPGFLMLLLLQTAAREGGRQAQAAASFELPSPTCNRTCGGVDVPYPFGLDSDDPAAACHLRDGATDSFALTCDRTHNPPKLFTGNIERYRSVGGISRSRNVEVTGINISSGNLRVLLQLAFQCFNSTGDFVEASVINATLTDPFVFSPTENVFMVVGCEGVAGFTTEVYNFGGCVSGCNSLETAVDGECQGLGCCEAPNLPGVKSYRTWVYMREKTSIISKFNPCSYHFMVEKHNYTFKRSDLNTMDKERRLPVILDWSIGNRRCDQVARNASSYACVAGNSECVDSVNSTAGYLCKCSQGYWGNPYLLDGCTDMDECKEDRATYPCYGECRNYVGGYECRCPKGGRGSAAVLAKANSSDPILGLHMDFSGILQNSEGIPAKGYGSKDPKRVECIKEKGLSQKSIVSIAVGGGVLLVALISALCCLEFQRRKINTLREKHFESNGGMFLLELLSTHQSAFKIFSYRQLKKATNNFSKVLGRGGFGIVYRGTAEDGVRIAVKRSTKIGEENSRGFANELFILSQVNHRNIVKLLGCCLEDETPMLVYEFVPGGTLFDLIHDDGRRISFPTRLHIATRAAEAFKYLHLDAAPPVLHGDVKSANILLDGDLQPKVSDFGFSKLVANDRSKLATLVRGTFGYLDPEYIRTGVLKDKSDVFSFGVVLLELLTRTRPMIPGAESGVLYINFLSCVREDKLGEILDPELVGEGFPDEVGKLVGIAVDCLQMKGERRPTMKEVVLRLECIRASDERAEILPSASSRTVETKALLEAPASTSTSTCMQSDIFSLELGR